MSEQNGSDNQNEYGGNPQNQYGANPGPYGGPAGPPQPPNNPPGGPGYGGGPSGSFNQGVNESKGFFGALFDFSFNHFVTPIIIKVVYVLATIALAIGWVVFVITGFTQSAGLGILFLIIGAIGVLLYLAIIRMTLEFYLAVVRMSEDVHRRLPRF